MSGGDLISKEGGRGGGFHYVTWLRANHSLRSKTGKREYIHLTWKYPFLFTSKSQSNKIG